MLSLSRASARPLNVLQHVEEFFAGGALPSLREGWHELEHLFVIDLERAVAHSYLERSQRPLAGIELSPELLLMNLPSFASLIF